MKLTVGMAVYDDFSGVWTTVQAMRMYHSGLIDEILVVDNNPSSRDGEMTKTFIEGWTKGARYIPFPEPKGTSAPRQHVFDQATGDIVICTDSHVLFPPNSIRSIREYFEANPDSKDLVSGPMVYDNLTQQSTHFEDVWREEMWGIWATDARGEGQTAFEIPAMGLGCFAMRRTAWPGFNPNFRQFGGEEWYIHEKVRQHGGKCLCLPEFKWVHRFGRPNGPSYPLTLWHKVRNYVIGCKELGMSLDRVKDHFVRSNRISEEQWEHLLSSDPPPLQPKQAPQSSSSCGGCAVPETLEKWYEKAATTTSDINEHVPTLRELASKCEHVTEFGVRRGVSTVALLAGQPKRLISYDIHTSPEASGLKDRQGKCEFEFRLGDSRTVDIEPTDMLFIDTVHIGTHLMAELKNSAHKVRKYLVFHDTEAPWGERGEDGGQGVMPAIREFLWKNPEWTVKKHYRNNHGLTVLSKLPEDRKELPSKLRQAWNFAKAQTRHAMNSGRYLPLPLAQERMKECSICEMRSGENCAMCGCFLLQIPDDSPVRAGQPGKVFYPMDYCPLGRWHPRPNEGVEMTDAEVKVMMEEVRK